MIAVLHPALSTGTETRGTKQSRAAMARAAAASLEAARRLIFRDDFRQHAELVHTELR